MTLRRLRVLVEHLPPDSATARAVLGHTWQSAEWLLADIRDDMARLVTAFLNAHRDEKSPELQWPEPVWRPGDPSPEEKAQQQEQERAANRAAYEEIVSIVAPGR